MVSTTEGLASLKKKTASRQADNTQSLTFAPTTAALGSHLSFPHTCPLKYKLIFNYDFETVQSYNSLQHHSLDKFGGGSDALRRNENR